MEDVSHLDVDEVWETLGKFGRYQVTQLLILIIGGLPISFHILSVVFIGKDVDHVCSLPPERRLLGDNVLSTNTTVMVTVESCKIYRTVNRSDTLKVFESSCANGYNYSGNGHTSFVAQWDLVCDREPLGKLSQTLVMAGMCAGASLLPPLGDRFGTKKLHVGCHFLMFVVSMAMAFVPKFEIFLVLRFFVGAFQQGYIVPLIILMLELFPAHQRELIGFSGAFVWAVSVIIITPFAYVLRHQTWKNLQIVLAAFSAFSILQMWILDESLRWLVANKKTEGALKVIKKAAKMNHKNFEEVMQKIQDKSETRHMIRLTEQGKESGENSGLLVTEPTVELDYEPPPIFIPKKTTKTKKKKNKVNILDILKNATLRPIAMIICFSWITNALTYYGLALMSSSLAGDHYVNFLLGAVLEIPADVMMWILMKKIGRKKTCIVLHMAAGLCMLAAVFVAALAGDSSAAPILLTTFSLAGRFFIVGSFNAVWLYTPEIFPTNIRNVGLGIASSSGRIGGMAAPFFNSLAKIAIWSPGAIFSACCLLATFLITFLPETSGRELPQTIEDLANWRRKDKEMKNTRNVYK